MEGYVRELYSVTFSYPGVSLQRSSLNFCVTPKKVNIYPGRLSIFDVKLIHMFDGEKRGSDIVYEHDCFLYRPQQLLSKSSGDSAECKTVWQMRLFLRFPYFSFHYLAISCSLTPSLPPNTPHVPKLDFLRPFLRGEITTIPAMRLK